MRSFPHTPRLPSDCFEEIESLVKEDGTVVRQFRLKGTDLIGQQLVMDKLFKCELVKVEPMKMPAGPLFFLDFEMPK